MERFKYKTRGMQSPQGIPRVFFCSHPKDFDRFFEGLSKVGYRGSMTLECTSMQPDGTLTPKKMKESILRVRALSLEYLN